MKLARSALIVGLLVLFSTLAFAQTAKEEPFNPEEGDIDKVIVASTTNFPDALISSAPATKLGIPVVLTDKNELSAEASESFEKFGVKEAYIVGGPSVVSEDVEEEIDTQVNSTTRLWGMSQVGTSIEVSEYFWSEGSEKAIIVQYPQDEEKGYRLLTAIKNEMSDIEGSEAPILISQEGTLSSSVLSEVERLGASEAEVYSTKAVNVSQDLEDAGVEDVEVEEAEIDELTDRLQETEGNVSKLVVVAAPNYRDALSTPSVSGGKVKIISNESGISSAIQTVQDTNPEEIMVVGKPGLAQTAAKRIENETGQEVEHVSGRPEEMASKMMNRSRKEWRQKQKERFDKWKEDAKKSPGMQKAANRTINRAEEYVTENSSEKAQQLLLDAQDAYDNQEYFKARDLAVKALSMAKSEDFREMGREEMQEHIQQEREGMNEIASEMSEMNQERAKELREAESFEERMETINEFKQEQREVIQDLRNETTGEQSEFRQRMKEKFESETETESKGSELRLKLKGTELELEAKYTAPTGEYSADKDFQIDGENIDLTYTLQSPDGSATQALTEHETEVERELEEGTYSLNMKIVVDGETVNQVEEGLEVPGFERSRSRHRSSSTSTETRREVERRRENRTEEFRERAEERIEEFRNRTESEFEDEFENETEEEETEDEPEEENETEETGNETES